MEREKERKRPCLRLNYPPDGKCNDCIRGSCRYDKICFVCGNEGHGAFQTFPGGKMKGELKCAKHRNYVAQMLILKNQYGLDDEEVRAIFIPPKNILYGKLSSSPISDQFGVNNNSSGSVLSSPASPLPLSTPVSPPQLSLSSPVDANNLSSMNSISFPIPPQQNYQSFQQSSDHIIPSRQQSSDVWGQRQVNLNPSSSNNNDIDVLALELTGSGNIGTSSSSVTSPPSQYSNSYSNWGNSSSSQSLLSDKNTSSPSGLSNMNNSNLSSVQSSPPLSGFSLGGLGSIGNSGIDMNIGGGLGSISSILSSSSIPPAPVTATGATPSAMISFEITDNDQFNSASILRFSSSHILKENVANNGVYCKGTVNSDRGAEDVSVFAWRKNTSIDSVTLRQDIKMLKIIAASSNGTVTRIMHNGALNITNNGGEITAIVSEYSEIGYLDRFISSYLQTHPEGIPNSEIQAMSCQLIDAVLRCHSFRVTHRNISASNILVTRGERYQTNASGSGHILKLTDFKLSSLAIISQENDLDKWSAPEVTIESKNRGVGFQALSDAWSIGLVLYFIGTGGQCLFDSHKSAREAIIDNDKRRQYLEKNGLHERNPVLYDLIERLIRPIQTRTTLSSLRCHPFMWTNLCRKKFLIEFSNASNTNNKSVDSFINGMDRFCPHYVFGTDGWVKQMNRDFIDYIQPASLKTDFWWSGMQLLQAIRNQLLYPERLYSDLYSSRLSTNQMLALYLKQTLDVDFPRLVILLFELGGLNGKWEWDGDEVKHIWN
jgi:serine/threonine protein kinase